MHNTGNPLGSTQVLDLYDNSEAIDQYVNSQEDSFPDRFGTKRLTLAGLIKRSMALRNEINDFSGALTFKPEWTDVPMNVSEGVGGEGGALNLQAEALGNRTEVNKVNSREALRRTYLEIGLNLVDGSFEAGGELKTPADILLEEKTGKCYSWSGSFPKVVNKGMLPNIEVGFVDRSGLRATVTVSSFGPVGTNDDTAVIQKAINYAFKNKISLIFTPLPDGKEYKSRQLLLPENSAEPVEPFYIIGNGSTIKILGEDHLFSVDGDFFYDLFVGNLHFEGEELNGFAGNNNKIFNTKKLIRLIVNSCSSRYVNSFFDCPWSPPQTSADYAQSVYATNCIYRRGGRNGYFFNAPVAFDISLTDCLVEQCWNGLKIVSQSGVGNRQVASSVRIRGGAWESISGTAIGTGPVYQLSISGVYFEANGADINLSFNPGDAQHLGVGITDNIFYLTLEQRIAGYKPITWGVNAAGHYITSGNKSSGNLHDIFAATGTFDFANDYAVGELYNGMDAKIPRSIINNPIGRVKFRDNTGEWFFNGLTIFKSDIELGGLEYGKLGAADQIGNERFWPRVTHGSENPQTLPGLYGNAKWCRGSIVFNQAPIVLGVVGDQYIIDKWVCITSGFGGTDRWVECRCSIGV